MDSEESVQQGLQIRAQAYFIMFMCTVHCKEAEVLKKLSLAGLAYKVWFGLSRLSWTRNPR
jgi:hypothetical protein